jgi:small subunit ribosomal protein S20
VADNPSAIKRHRQSLKRHDRNRAVRSKLKTLIKGARTTVEAKDREKALGQLREANRALDKAVSQGILKRSTASRKMSRLARAASVIPSNSQQPS